MADIALAHDYLCQMGGAERVVSQWVKLFPTSPVYTMAYVAEDTFDCFDQVDVRASLLGRSKFAGRNLHRLLPLLPSLAASVTVEADYRLVLASTSGFAHGFTASCPVVAYCHSPARWLYETGDYSQGLSRTARLGLQVSRNYLLRRDAEAAGRVAGYIANSRVTAARLERAYGISAEVVHPPVAMRRRAPGVELPALPDMFALCVARARGYKNLGLAITAAVLADVPLVIVGAGTAAVEVGTNATVLGRVSDDELTELYSRASMLLAVGHEDFGLTPVEAAQFGTPTVAVGRGGYLETIRSGINGVLADESVNGVAAAISEAASASWSSREITESARRFSPERHKAALLAAITRLNL